MTYNAAVAPRPRSGCLGPACCSGRRSSAKRAPVVTGQVVHLGLVRRLRCRRLAVRASASGAEELDKQLCDALSLVVVDPVGGVGQALDAVKVRHVVVIRFGKFRAEVMIT